MYLPRNLISQLYLQLLKSHHPLSPPVLILVALEPDALCACRILTSLLKRDYIPHKIQPVGGYADLSKAGEDLVKPMRLGDGGSGGVVVCLGVGGLVDLETILGLEVDEEGNGGCDGVDVWVLDARRPWNLSNVFGGAAAVLQNTHDQNGVIARKAVYIEKGEVQRTFRQGKGGIIVFDDGDIQEELTRQRDAWFALEDMPEVEDVDDDAGSDSDEEEEDNAMDSDGSSGRKRKSWSDREDDEEEDEEEKENERPRQRRRSNSVSCLASGTISMTRLMFAVNANSILTLVTNSFSSSSIESHSTVHSTFKPAFLTRQNSTITAFSQIAKAKVLKASTKARRNHQDILRNGNIIFRAHIVLDVLTGIRTRSGRQ